jgi:Rps23 Pro-64 3,4-dihydroxylase Tpa1-like proline 4-hydroxylase
MLVIVFKQNLVMSYIFDLSHLREIAQKRASDYQSADPYPHIVLDDFLNDSSARQMLENFPGPHDGSDWDRYAYDGFEMKIANAKEEQFSPLIRNALHDLNSGPFIRFLQELTGIEHLFSDPHLLGGGAHLTGRGGHLGVHADFNWHPELHAHRRVNMMIYFNDNWRQDYDGDLELWSTDATRCIKSIEPHFNRAVIFNSTSNTFHGHPKPLKIPDGQWRRSIAMYYYSTERPETEVNAPHNTRYKGLHLE